MYSHPILPAGVVTREFIQEPSSWTVNLQLQLSRFLATGKRASISCVRWSPKVTSVELIMSIIVFVHDVHWPYSLSFQTFTT